MSADPFPLLYHAHHSRYTEDIPLWLDLARQINGPILELGCGSGRVLFSLVNSGFHVVGLDNDPGMLAVLGANAPRKNTTRFQIILEDITAFHLGIKFPLILLPCNTFSTFSSSERQIILKLVYHHLQPEGIFATSIPNPQALRALPARGEPEIEDVFPHPQDSEPVQVISSWQRTHRNFTLTYHYDHMLPDGKVERTTVKTRHTLTPTNTYLQAFQDAGLRVENILGNYDHTAYSARAPRLIFIARRPAH